MNGSPYWTHSGIPELIEDRRTGFLAPEKDVGALAAHLAWIANNPGAAHPITFAARKHVEAGVQQSDPRRSPGGNDRGARTEQEGGMNAPVQFGKVALRGSLITGVSQAVKIGLQFLSVVVLARMLVPEDFGLVAAVGPIVAFVAAVPGSGVATGGRPACNHHGTPAQSHVLGDGRSWSWLYHHRRCDDEFACRLVLW